MYRPLNSSNVCVVGGAGFLGSHLVNHLIDDRNCRVLVVDNLEVGRREFIHPKAGFAHHDITGSEARLLELFVRYDIEFVFNYAARPYVPDSYNHPLRTFDVNLMGALKVINAAHEAKCQAILQVSSAEVYGGNTNVLMGEGTPVFPVSSYGASKAAVDAAVQVMWRERGVKCIALRQFNCVGERETHPYIVPEIVSQLSTLANTSVGVVSLGNNSQRDFMYAGDAVAMAARLIEEGEFGDVYNLGSSESVYIYTLAQEVGEAMGFREVRAMNDPTRNRRWEIWHLKSDNSKIEAATGMKATTTRREALQRTVAHYFDIKRKWTWEK